jgi:multiple sugar transport system ATP-binding protein
MAQIRLDNIRKTFGALEVIKGVSLDIRKGEFMVFVGPSGCGKSTLLRLISGLEDITSGTLSFDGEAVNRHAPSKRGIAMVFQSYALYPHMTVFENMAFGMKLSGRTTQERKTRVEQAAGMLQLSPYLERLPRQLSGGQRQRVALGRAMVRDPAVFLMDEPLSNLDAKLRVQMRAEIIALHRRLGVTFVYVTHDQAEAMTMSDRVAVMMDGELLQVDRPERLYRDPEDLRVAEMIGSPKINVVARAHWMSLGASLPAGVHRNTAYLAFRPEAVGIVASGDGRLNGVVASVENLGSDIFLNVTLADGQGTVIVRTHPDASRSEAGRSIGLQIDPACLLQFDNAGRRQRQAEQVEAAA